ncbi:hypothetical protein LTR17_004495 [Elasticomyces elasticus]|nr:hypothetical protein LTR17_004495 [Elasticomyces elasticus]
MAPTITITRRGQPDIGEIEKSLGIKWSRGLFRESGRLKIPIIRELEHALKQVIRQYTNVLSTTELETSAELEAAANTIFDSLGARVWPDGSENPEWLAEATRDDLDGYYRENLFFSSVQHRAKLRQLFYSLVVAKCLMYVKNHGSASKKQRRSAPVSKDESGELPRSEMLSELSDDEKVQEEPGDGAYSSHSRSSTQARRASRPRNGGADHIGVHTRHTSESASRSTKSAKKRKLAVEGKDEVSNPNLRSIIVVLKVDPQKLARVLATIPERDFSITFQGLGYVQQSIRNDDDTQASAPLHSTRLPQPSTITPADPDMGQVREILPRAGPVGMEAASHDRPQELQSQVLPLVASSTAALQDTGHSLEPDLFAILEKAEVEVDWETPAVPPSFISLEACHSIDDLFVSIDGQVPLPLRHRHMEAVNIEHTNHQGEGKPITGYVRRGEAGVASFRALFRRLKKLDAATELELRITVEWAL